MSSETIENGCATPSPRPLWQRVIRWFFAPYEGYPWPPEDKKLDGERIITTEIVIALDWKDRLRMLVSGPVQVKLVIITENPPGKVESRANTWVVPPV